MWTSRIGEVVTVGHPENRMLGFYGVSCLKTLKRRLTRGSGRVGTRTCQERWGKEARVHAVASQRSGERCGGGEEEERALLGRDFAGVHTITMSSCSGMQSGRRCGGERGQRKSRSGLRTSRDERGIYERLSGRENCCRCERSYVRSHGLNVLVSDDDSESMMPYHRP